MGKNTKEVVYPIEIMLEGNTSYVTYFMVKEDVSTLKQKWIAAIEGRGVSRLLKMVTYRPNSNSIGGTHGKEYYIHVDRVVSIGFYLEGE